jgi:hypothetical protein
MPRRSPTYEKPSRIAQGLVVGFSIAVVAMACWLAITILLSDGASTVTAIEPDIDTAGTPPYVEIASPRPAKLSAMESADSVFPDPPSRTYAPYSAPSPPSPRSALSLASPADSPSSPAPSAKYVNSSVAAEVPETNYRGVLGEESRRLAEALFEAAETSTDVVPLPLPNPRRFASTPVPRPRPRFDADDTRSSSDESFFEMLINRQR